MSELRSAATKETLKKALEECGVRPGMILEVHCSFSRLPFVVGGSRTVVDALMEEEEDGGTIVMDTSAACSGDPSAWNDPSAPASMWSSIRSAMPPYDPEKTDLPEGHEVEENFRHREGVVCSCHPAYSYTAWGRYAKLLCNRQSMHFPLAEESPAARLYEMKGYFLLIGTDLSESLTMRLGQYRTESAPACIRSACMLAGGRKTWKKYLDLETGDQKACQEVVRRLEKKKLINTSLLDNCEIRLIPIQPAVDEMTDYLSQNSIYDLYR